MSSIRSLTYDDTPHKRRWSAKWLVVLGLLTAVAAGWRWWPVAWRDVNLWVDGVLLSCSSIPSDQLAIDSRGLAIMPRPRAWVRFHDAYEGALSFEQSTLLLCDRVAPNGSKRLVEVGGWGGSASSQDAPVNAMVWESFKFDRTHSVVDLKESSNFANGPVRPGGIELYTGMADPVDRSHFTIRCRVWGSQKIVDGYLMNDGTVRLETRPSPFSGRPEGAPFGQVPLRGHR